MGVEFAAAQGAVLLQVRPSPELTGEQMATAWIMVEWLADMHRGKLVIHIDAVNRYNLRREPEDLAAEDEPGAGREIDRRDGFPTRD